MLLEGTSSKSSKEISEGFDALGAFIDISSGFDDITLTVHGLKKNFEQVLLLLSEILNDSVFPEKEFELLRSIRIDQLSVNDQKNDMYASKMMRSQLFGPNHPYGYVLKEEHLNAVQLSEVKAYYDSTLFSNPVLYISGQVDDALINTVNRIFKVPKASLQNATAVGEIISTRDVLIERGESLQSSIRMAWGIPSMTDEGYHDFVIANTFLGGYFGSRLMKNIREDKGYTYGISSYPIHLKNASFSVISTDVKAEYTQKTIDEIGKEIETLATGCVEADEMSAVSNYLAGTFLASINTPFELMKLYKRVHDQGLDYGYYQSYFNALKDISNEKIQIAIKKHFDISKAYTTVVGLKN